MRNRWSSRLIPILLLTCICTVTECLPETAALGVACAFAETSDLNLEHQMFMMTNEERAQQGLRDLVPDDALSAIAREQSRGMATQGFISHNLPSGDLQTRLNRGGYFYQIVRENVASSHSIEHAQNALMYSPPHKQNILAADVQRVGIGIVRCPPPYENEIYITEIFAAPREEYRPADMQEALRNRMNDLRRLGVGSLRPDPDLEKLASESVASLDATAGTERLQDLLADSANKLQKSGRPVPAHISANIQLLHNPKNFDLHIGIGQQAGSFGTGIRQVIDSRKQSAFVVLTLMEIE
jgi:uncharacterized protein YkwD